MTELLQQIAIIYKAVFTEWIPTIINADLGPLGMIGTTITAIGLAITIVKRLLR